MAERMSQCTPLLRRHNGTAIDTIVHWSHERGGEAHCLARVRLASNAASAIVLLSEIRSNDRVRDIGADFNGVANALFHCLQSDLEGVPPDHLTWIAHYGKFSSYDAVGPDQFIRVNFHWNGQQFEKIQASEQIVWQDVASEFGSIELGPIYQTLREIGWTKHNE